MPSPLVKKLAEDTDIDFAEAEKRWKNAKQIAEDQTGMTEADGEDFWKYVTGVFKKSMGIGEDDAIMESATASGRFITEQELLDMAKTSPDLWRARLKQATSFADIKEVFAGLWPGVVKKPEIQAVRQSGIALLDKGKGQPDTVYRDIYNLSTGEPMGLMTEPYDGTLENLLSAWEKLQRRLPHDASNSQSPIAATDASGRAKYYVSSNGRFITDLQTGEEINTDDYKALFMQPDMERIMQEMGIRPGPTFGNPIKTIAYRGESDESSLRMPSRLLGTFFSASKEVATAYATNVDGTPKKGAKLIEVQLNLLRPYFITEEQLHSLQEDDAKKLRVRLESLRYDSIVIKDVYLLKAGLKADEYVIFSNASVTELSETPLETILESAPSAEEIHAAAHEAATSHLNDLPHPTEAQKKAGTYKMGHVMMHGLDISIENPKGSTRSGVSPDGTAWSSTMTAHYGYIKRSEGADGDHVDVFIGDSPESEAVFIIDQVDPATGRFDEHKCMLAYRSESEAKAAYLANYDDTWQGFSAITGMTMDDFKAWLKGATTKPICESILENATGGTVIEIWKSPTADIGTNDFSTVTKEQLLDSSLKHISDVSAGMAFFAQMLNEAAARHDHDKISDIDGFHRDFLTGFKQTEWWDNHRKVNRHHLLQPDGIPTDINIIDVLDMIVDCVMAGMARSGSVYPLDIPPDVLMTAFQNTVELLKSQVKVVDAPPIEKAA